MRLSRSLLLCTALIGGFSSMTTLNGQAVAADAQSSPAQSTPAASTQDRTIVTVDGQKIMASDLQHEADSLPPKLRQFKPDVLVPMLLNQLIKAKALEIQAEKEGLAKKPEVQAAIADATKTVLLRAYLRESVMPHLTDSALQAYYQAHYANKKPEEEIHARHILVNDATTAKSIIRQLNKGADFAKLAARYSKDKGTGGTNGGDLGWFKRGDMDSEFSNVVFSMKSGSITQQPIHTQYGWHVVQVEDTRSAPVPGFEQVRDKISNELTAQEVNKVVENAVKQVRIVQYDAKGQPITQPASGAAPAGAAH